MLAPIIEYFETLFQRFGEGWNRFWFTPTNPLTTSVLRVLTGAIALYWQLAYTPDLVRLFGPEGLLPAEMVATWTGGGLLSWSYLSWASSAGELWAFHLLGTAVLIAFTLGFYTRVTSVLALVVVLSYVHRAPMLTSQFEPILAFTLFYLCFAPAGRYLSIDRWRAAKQPHDARMLLSAAERAAAEESAAATVSLRLLQVHLTVVYAMMALGKLNGSAWWTGEAMWWLLAKPDSRPIDLTGLLSGAPLLLNAWTHAVVWFELGFALLVWNRLARPLMLGLAVPMWALLSLATGLHLFCLMMVVANVAFIEPATLRRLCPWLDRFAAEPAAAPSTAEQPLGQLASS